MLSSKESILGTDYVHFIGVISKSLFARNMSYVKFCYTKHINTTSARNLN
jgi:hypothetical protein